MATTVFSLAELPADLKQKWCDVLALNPGLGGPCFHPDLFSAVGQHYPSIFVAVLGTGDQLGFLPFSREGSRRLALPVPFCDYQAVIAAAGQRWNVDQVLSEINLQAWDFEHLVGAENLDFAHAFLKPGGSSRIDLRNGSDAYFAKVCSRNVSFRNLLNKRDQLEKKHGSVRFVLEDQSGVPLESIIRWKAERFNGGQPPDVRMRLVFDSLKESSKLSPVTSALYAGDTLVAAHFGLRFGGVLHYWMPGFNATFRRFTPGHLLVYQLLTHLDQLGCQILDFGPGGESYKQYFSNSTLPVSRGGIELISRFTLERKYRRNFLAAVRSTRWFYQGLRFIKSSALKMIAGLKMKIRFHPRARWHALLTYPRFLGRLKPELMGGREGEVGARLRALEYRWEPAVLRVPIGKRILVVAPHPDDESIGPGGTLLAHRGQAEVHLLNLFNGSAGGRLPGGPLKGSAADIAAVCSERQRELGRVAQRLAVKSVRQLGMEDGTGFPSADEAHRFRKIVDEIRPDVVLLPWFLDNQREHKIANLLFASACPNYDGLVLGYEIWTFCHSNAFFDISDWLDEKVKLVNEYRTQTLDIDYAGYARGLGIVRGFHQGTQGQRSASEAFLVLPGRDYCDIVHSLYGRIDQLTASGQALR